MQTTINRQTVRQSALRIVFGSVLMTCLTCLSSSLVAQSAGPSAQISEPAKPAQKTPPFPREGTDLETSMREKHEYMQWMHDNNENVSTILLKLKPEIDGSPRKLVSRAKAKEIGGAAGIKLEPERLTVPEGWQVLKLPKRMTEKAVNEDICVKLKQHQYVLECTPNGAIFPLGAPTDPFYSQQWSFSAGPGSANIEKAWGTTTGAANTVIAVLDSGITTHEDLLASRILPGYDFVTDLVVANDGAGRDATPSDPGNWITAAESGGNSVLRNCEVRNSNWHGTHIAGIIGAIANNPAGVAGINWAAKLLPVRVLGKCGNPTNGPDDLTAALLWAAGVDIGTPTVNPNPAQVINISLSGTGTCPPNVQEAINQATAKGAVVIAAAGNDNRNASYWPANCSNVLTVIATNEIGDRWKVSSSVGSNWGADGVAAPGTAILSAVNPGTTSPVASSGYRAYTGTSQAAAHVSGIASLMLAVKPSLTPFEVREIIKASAKKFARGSSIILGSCSSGSCGSGIVNAAEAVKQARAGRPVAGGITQFRPANIVTNTPDGQVVGWGSNSLGQLGGANPSSILSPAMVNDLTQVDRVFAAGATTWAIRSTGEAYALGQGSYCSVLYGQFGECDPLAYRQNYFSFFGADPLAVASAQPVRTPFLDNVKQIFVNYSHLDGSSETPAVFAITSSGGVLAWGYDAYGTLGLGFPAPTISVIQTPTLIAGLPPIRQIATTESHTFALDQSGNVWGWGFAGYSKTCSPFGNGAPEYSVVPIRIPGLSNVVHISSSPSYWLSSAVKQDGTVWQWGCAVSLWPTPAQVNLDRVVAVSLSDVYGMAIRDDGSLWRWDLNDPSGSPNQLVSSGVLGFINFRLARMADGHILDLESLRTSALSPSFARSLFRSVSYGGRLNVAESSLADTNLAVSIAGSSATIQPGESFDYLASVQNSGPDAATNSGVSIALPAGVTVVSVPAGCSLQGQILTCSVGTLGAGQSAAFSVKVQAVTPDSVVATAYAYSDSYDYSSADNTAGVDVVIQPLSSVIDGGDVPTLPEWGVILMGSLLLVNMAWVNRRKYRG